MSTEQPADIAGGEITTPDQQITFHSHYIKDLSFENPNAPLIYNDPSAAPQVSVNFSVSSRPIPDKDRHYEVVLMIKASAMQGEQTMFLAELSFGRSINSARYGRKSYSSGGHDRRPTVSVSICPRIDEQHHP